ncbi:MAG: hypothetical protein AB7U23_13245 [Dehalococcoidia bacterium]
MTPDPRFPAPVFALEVDGTRVREDVLSLLKRVQVNQNWDGADEITLQLRAWDEHDARFRIAGEQVFAPGRSVVLRAGYGTADHVVGRFSILPHALDLSSSASGATVTVSGFDGLERLMGGQDPRDLRTAKTYTDCAEAVALEYGFGIVSDAGGEVPTEARSRRNRRGETSEVAPSIRKRAGDTDLRFLKLMAAHNRFESPKVRYVEQNSPLLEIYRRNHDRVVQSTNLGSGLAGGDVLMFRRFNVRRQEAAEAGPWVFRYQRDDLVPASLSSFNANWNGARPALAVRVSGRTPDGRIETVQARVRDRQALLAGSTDAVVIEQVDTRRAMAKDRQTLGVHGQVLVEILGELRPVKRYNPQTKRREEVIGRDVIRETLQVNDVGGLHAYARDYLIARMSLFITASMTAANLPGLHRLYPNQGHRIEGVPDEYVGWYRTMNVTHIWMPNGGTHTVTATVEKLADVEPTITAEAVR